jgi:hypothetical protein
VLTLAFFRQRSQRWHGRFAMSSFDGLPKSVASVLLVGAEECAETADASWIREATAQEWAGFEAYCRQLVRTRDGDKAAAAFSLRDWTVDGTGRPYWLKAFPTLRRSPWRRPASTRVPCGFTRCRPPFPPF